MAERPTYKEFELRDIKFEHEFITPQLAMYKGDSQSA